MNTRPQRPAWQIPAGLPQAADEHWSYILDDTNIMYGPGWWPFYTDRNWPLTGGVNEAPTQPCGVRLAPDIAFYAWHTEYLLLYPTDEPGVVSGSCHVTPRDTSRHHAERLAFQLRMHGERWLAEPVGSPTHDADVLAEKTRRAVDFLHAAIAERNGGARQPTTAADREPRPRKPRRSLRPLRSPRPEPDQRNRVRPQETNANGGGAARVAATPEGGCTMLSPGNHDANTDPTT
jgi:hypothetical protein